MKFGNSEPQTGNVLNLKKFLEDCYTGKQRKPGNKIDTKSLVELSLEQMKEQHPPWVRVE